MGDVVLGAAREHVACVGAPQTERRVGRREVAQLGRAVRGQVIDEPLLLRHPGVRAGDDAEPLRAEPHDREVGFETAALVEQGGVDDTPDRHVQLGDGESLQGRQGIRTGDVEYHEGRQIGESAALTQREVLGVDDRRPPARLPLGAALHEPPGVSVEQGTVALVPVGTFPARGLEEDGPEVALLEVGGAAPDGALGLPLLSRVHDAVHLVEALACACLDVLAGALVVVEACDVRFVQVDLGRLAVHPLRDGARDARSLLDPTRGHGPQALHLGRLAERRVAVGGYRDESVDGVADADRLVAQQFGHQLEGVLELGVEVVLGERHLGRREGRLLDRGDLPGLDDDRAVGVGADLQVAAVLALVHVGVHVAHDRVDDLADGVGEERYRADADHLMHDRGQWDRGAGHRSDARAPHATAHRHDTGLNDS